MKLLIILLSINIVWANGFVDGFPMTSEKEKKLVPLFKQGDCIKYSKEGESFWKNEETLTLFVEQVGLNNLKVKRINFLSSKEWFYSEEALALSFMEQKKFSKTQCPDLDKELKGEELNRLLKNNN